MHCSSQHETWPTTGSKIVAIVFTVLSGTGKDTDTRTEPSSHFNLLVVHEISLMLRSTQKFSSYLTVNTHYYKGQ
jgi:hypothetical protein